jgi:hypothetical protein
MAHTVSSGRAIHAITKTLFVSNNAKHFLWNYGLLRLFLKQTDYSSLADIYRPAKIGFISCVGVGVRGRVRIRFLSQGLKDRRKKDLVLRYRIPVVAKCVNQIFSPVKLGHIRYSYQCDRNIF